MRIATALVTFVLAWAGSMSAPAAAANGRR